MPCAAGQLTAASCTLTVGFPVCKQCIRSSVGNSKSTSMRTAALRVLQLFCRQRSFVEQLAATGIDYFVVRSLERVEQVPIAPPAGAAKKKKKPTVPKTKLDPQARRERIAALHLIHTIVSVAADATPRAILQSIVAVAEATEDALRIQW